MFKAIVQRLRAKSEWNNDHCQSVISDVSRRFLFGVGFVYGIYNIKDCRSGCLCMQKHAFYTKEVFLHSSQAVICRGGGEMNRILLYSHFYVIPILMKLGKDILAQVIVQNKLVLHS